MPSSTKRRKVEHGQLRTLFTTPCLPGLVHIVHMAAEICIAANKMLPISPLPNAPLDARARVSLDELLAFCSLCSAMQLLATSHCLPVFQCFRQFLERKQLSSQLRQVLFSLRRGGMEKFSP